MHLFFVLPRDNSITRDTALPSNFDFSDSLSVSHRTRFYMRDHTLKVEFILAEEYEVMRDRYNSAFHSDMLQAGRCEYDGVDTWLEGVRSFLKQPPWGQVNLSGGSLEEVKELGNLAQVDASRLSRAVKNSLYLPSLIKSIDECISQHRLATSNPISTSSAVASPIFCRLNECSMKQSTNYKVRPFLDGQDIVDGMLKDRRLTSWLALPKYNIKSTTIYLSDFDPSFACKNEYRVFVWKGRVTGISQYRWFTTEETEYHTEESARQIGKDILSFMERKNGLLSQLKKHRRNKQAPVSNNNPTVDKEAAAQEKNQYDDEDVATVADVVHTEGRVYLVEINLFGGETGCGSSLFHWKRDEPVLYGDGHEVVCRFLSRTTSSP